MYTSTRLTAIFLALSMCFFSCKDKNDFITPSGSAGAGPESELSIDELSIPDNFNFANTSTARLSVDTKDYSGAAIEGIPYTVYDYSGDVKGKKLATFLTNSSGKLDITYDFPKHITKILVETDFLGVVRDMTYDLYAGELYEESPQRLRKSLIIADNSGAYNYHGNYYSGSGTPDYLVTPDNLSESFLYEVNQSLPERDPVPIAHPQYLANGVESEVKFTGTTDLWVTFVHEGAGYRNALAYYTYNKNNPPSSVNDISKLTVVLPNCTHYSGNGSPISPGDKVYIGQFDQNTVVGWAVIANGWNGSNVGSGLGIYYSNPDFNPESVKNQHNVILRDDTRDLLLIGFEDLNREVNSDEDFNDLVFYITANPYSNIETSNFISISESDDTDGDGVIDVVDDYPTDPNRATDVYYPAETEYGVLMYEDLWPGKGDYDFNDLVVGYNYHIVINAQNEAVEMTSKFQIRAIGASYENGFAFRLDVPSSSISSVSGQPTFNSLYNLNSGKENHSTYTVIPVTANNWNHMSRSGNSGFSNTVQNEPKINYKDFDIEIEFTSPVALANLGTSPFDPFLVIDQVRGNEVHLSEFAPTSLADNSLFGTVQDDTKPGSNKYYLSKNNLPWALHIPYDFRYCREKESISASYYFFNTWATSGGVSATDWYMNNTSKRNQNKIFDK